VSRFGLKHSIPDKNEVFEAVLGLRLSGQKRMGSSEVLRCVGPVGLVMFMLRFRSRQYVN
jgi:hypothetical protein